MRRDRRVLKIVATIALAVTALIALIIVLDRPPSVGPKAQSVIDEITPGLVIGERIPPEVRTRYQLNVEPYMGFRTEHISDSLGIGRLFVYVDEYIDDSRPSVSAGARLEALTYFITDSARFAPIVARLDAALGTPSAFCFAADSGRVIQQRTWHAGHGREVLLKTWVATSPPVEPDGMRHWGWLDFAVPASPRLLVPCVAP